MCFEENGFSLVPLSIGKAADPNGMQNGEMMKHALCQFLCLELQALSF